VKRKTTQKWELQFDNGKPCQPKNFGDMTRMLFDGLQFLDDPFSARCLGVMVRIVRYTEPRPAPRL
jgi:hypothetical protein